MSFLSLLSIARSVLHTSIENFVLWSWMVSPFIVWVPIVKESPHRTPLPSVSYCITEDLVYLLFGWHPPVRVGSTMHSNELCRKTGKDTKNSLSWQHLVLPRHQKLMGKKKQGHHCSTETEVKPYGKCHDNASWSYRTSAQVCFSTCSVCSYTWGICRENPFLQKEKELLLSNTYDSAPTIHAKVKTNWDVFHWSLFCMCVCALTWLISRTFIIFLCWLLEHLQVAAAHDLLENVTPVTSVQCPFLFGYLSF